MEENKFSKKVRFSILFITLLNVMIMALWFYTRALPVIPIIENTEEKIIYLIDNKKFVNIDNFILHIERISRKRNVTYKIVNSDGKIIKDREKGIIDIILFNKIVKINNERYIISFYPNYHINFSRILFEYFIIEIISVSIIFIVLLLFASKHIINPINKIIDDIKNYKKGIKPVRKQLNDEFNVIQNEFIDLTEELDDEKKEQTRIISSISHDLKTPLTSIIGYSNLIDDTNDIKDIKLYNEKIISKANHMKELLNSFDDYLISNTNKKLKKRKISIQNIVADLKNDYEVELNNNNIIFKIIDKTKKCYINIDYEKIRRVFSNIISNSVRYLHDNGVITIQILEKNNLVTFIISDNGPGVDEKNLNKIFEPLFTTDRSRKIFGLGLSICKEFVELHNGNIKAYNDSGLTIEISIPKEDTTN